jgi:rRNA maturation endonuclease Nob1
VGVPARQIGWMCRCAAARLHFDAEGRAQCPACGQSYQLTDGRVQPGEAIDPEAPKVAEIGRKFPK